MNATGQITFPDDSTFLSPSSLTDSEIEDLMRQEPLPPNQAFQLPAEEISEPKDAK